MRQSELFLKTKREAPKDELSPGTQLLLRAGYIDKLMAGSYSFLPLGLRVLHKIEAVIRDELNATGAQEVLMPLLHPRTLWEDTGRWDTADEVMFKLEKNDRDFGLAFTHEEVVMDIVRKHTLSYKDFPIKLYHFSNKFRNEPRARAGLLRGIEFLMNDLYSLHTDEADFRRYYDEVIAAYQRIFTRIGLSVKVVEAAGGVFTAMNTHEFQVLTEHGEDTIYYCESCGWSQNKEIATVGEGDQCPRCGGTVRVSRAIEVGNIFPLGTWYAEKMNVNYVDEQGAKRPVWFASYGIGTSRLVGTVAEVSNDDRGLIWPDDIAPYRVHLVNLAADNTRPADTLYRELVENKIETLYDDRGRTAGEKLADTDLIGLPIRIIVSEKTLEKSQAEIKYRTEESPTYCGLKDVVPTLKKSV